MAFYHVTLKRTLSLEARAACNDIIRPSTLCRLWELVTQIFLFSTRAVMKLVMSSHELYKGVAEDMSNLV